MSLGVDMQNIIHGRNDADNFSSQLLRLLFKADNFHRGKLAREYPIEGLMVQFWKEGDVDQNATGEEIEKLAREKFTEIQKVISNAKQKDGHH